MKFKPFPIAIPALAATCACAIFFGTHFSGVTENLPGEPGSVFVAGGNTPSSKKAPEVRESASRVSRKYELKGVLVSKKSADSIAILALDGGQSIAYREGTNLAEQVSLLEIHPRYVVIRDNDVIERLGFRSSDATSQIADAADPIESKREPGDTHGQNSQQHDISEPEGNRSYPLNAQNPFFGRIRHSAAAG